MPSLGRLERAVARKCDAVITVSQGIATALRDTMAAQPIVITNSADRRANRPAERDIRSVIGLDADQRLLVMIGNYKSGIPFDFISEMVRELPGSIHVAFVGRGYEAAERRARAAGVAGRLHFPAARPPFEVTSFIATADAGLLLYRIISRNYRSALPNGFFHLLDAGLPIVRFALPEVEALISQAKIGPLLDADDPSRAARTIANFLESAEIIEARTAVSALADAVTWEAQELILRNAIDPVRTERSALHA
jgi:glycosyltransferase involved in cell wall biosynthesis